jgi:hypothetical protein
MASRLVTLHAIGTKDMTLLTDIKNYLAAGGDVHSLAGNDRIKIARDEEFVTDSRWFNYYEIVFAREVAVNVVTSAAPEMEYVGVTFAEGATEMQDASDEEPEVYAVKPVQVTVTEYRKV